MKKLLWAMLCWPMAFLMSGCAATEDSVASEAETDTKPALGYRQISQEKARKMMDTEAGFIIVDVRTEEEFASGHIPNAIVIPDFDVARLAPIELPDRDQMLLVYCRSGRRSKNAASVLVSLGYTNVYEFGGILTWPYEITEPTAK